MLTVRDDNKTFKFWMPCVILFDIFGGFFMFLLEPYLTESKKGK